LLLQIFILISSNWAAHNQTNLIIGMDFEYGAASIDFALKNPIKEHSMLFRNMKLNTRIIFLFMVVSLLPLMLSNIIFLKVFEDSVRSDLLNNLTGRLELKTESIEKWFSERWGDARMLSALHDTARFIDELSQAVEMGGYKGEIYRRALVSYSPLFERFGTIYNYDDLLLINPNGDVVYSNAKELDYMTNLFRGPYSGTALATGFKKSLRGETQLTDFTHYAPAGGRPIMFMTSPIQIDQKIHGVLALRLTSKAIGKIMKEKQGMGITGETYLVGHDFMMRSDSRFNYTDQSDILRTNVRTDLDRLAFMEKYSGITTDYRNEIVLGVSDRLNIDGLEWAIVAKIDEKEAKTIIRGLYIKLYLLLAGLFVTIYFLAWFFSKSLSRPLVEMTNVATELARGKLDQIVQVNRSDEIGDLADAFRSLIERKRQISAAASAVSEGDFNVSIEVRSQEDVMAQSINQMMVLLKSTTDQVKVIAGGNFSSEVTPRSEKDELGFALQTMVSSLRAYKNQNDRTNWIQKGIARMNDVLMGENDIESLASKLLSEIAEWLDAKVGAFYIAETDSGETILKLIGTFAFTHRKNLSNRYRPGEGLVGQAFLEKKQILVQNVPEDYIRISSGLGDAVPRYIYVIPVVYENTVKGVIEMAFFNPISDDTRFYLEQTAPRVAAAIEIAQTRARVEASLRIAQELSAELEAKQKALQQTNTELEEQTAQLMISEQQLQKQQAELETSNAELEEQAAQLKKSEHKLQQQQTELEAANDELTKANNLLERQKAEIEKARKNITEQAEQVAQASKYKSEFLANMSHELRTPLNSLLLLARSLRENPAGNLTEEQVESAGIIFDSGSDLLNLINDILDLSKIEAGRMELRLEEIHLTDIERTILTQFDYMAKSQELILKVITEPDIPPSFVSDFQRLNQVLKNLIGNAIKFTESGGITVTFAPPSEAITFSRSGLDPKRALAIHVTDTGIGIPPEIQNTIFEAFKQAETGDRRRFGGTGLGLSISKEIVSLLGGEIHLISEPGKGSTFSLYLPLQKETSISNEGGHQAKPPSISPFNTTPAPLSEPKMLPSVAIKDDRTNIGETDQVMLIVEDDTRFANILAGIIRERGFKCLIASTGEDGLKLAKTHKPNGIILDIQLPSMDGWAVLNTLKQDVSLRHIPVHIISVEEVSAKNLGIGAIGHAAKPISQEQILEVLERLESASAHSPKRVLVIEDDALTRKETVRIVGNGNVTVEEAATGKEALEALRTQTFSLMIMDLGLPDMQGIDLLKHTASENIALPPVIIHTVRELTLEEEYILRNYADSIILKDVRSQERLIDEIALFLHRVVRDLPEENQRAILYLRESNEPLQGKKLLIVEDDMRTMFGMARILGGYGILPIKAENGKRAVTILDEQPDIDLVLMDIMMPVMDGYEAIRLIRSQERFVKLPIIALTAKAMKEDRQKCLEAGATDYLSKPVDPDRLISLMRVLLCR
jgi:signal transduction histidine kinase/DNA-binding response OmpR family regulator